MENDILDSLEDLGYKGPLLEDGALDEAVTGGASSPEFTKLCAWLVSELKLYCKLEENVQATNSPNESEGFQLEMSGLLSEMMCPYSVLTSGDVTKRLLNKNNCLLLLTYLISELEATKMIHVNKPTKAPQQQGSEVFNELKGICMGLGMSKPPANITMFQFFSGIEKKLKEALSKVPQNHVGKPLMKKPLGPIHWEKVEAINQALVNEYDVRRKMLLKRLDVTVQSFGWSEKAKVHTEKLAKVYQPKRAALGAKSSISVANLFAAREDLSKILRTSSGRTREKTACAINKVLMGRVPDRGGRPNEIEPPPPEMPPWQKRQDGPQQFGGGGRGGGGRGGYDGQSHGGRGGYDGQSHGGRGGYDGQSHGGRGGYDGQSHGGRGGYDGQSHGGRGGYDGQSRGGRGGYDGQSRGGRGGYDGQSHGGRGGYDYQSRGGRGGGGRGGKVQGGWSEGGGGGGYQERGGGYSSGGYQGGFQSHTYQDNGYQGGGGGFHSGSGYQQDNRYQDGSSQERGGRGGRGGRGSGNRGGQGGGWGGRGGQNYNQGGQFEQYFQQGGYQYNQAGFGQGRHYTS
ncbi:protein FAM98A isoform X2 [Erpetoichthys calabaricus]|uniref:protein FAM98A isoform X2 n=1 Tax=Erpetoichthys calabaricus TaxID=27687 RepID=UPI0010A01932|nr:protein FAM98A isoform X2 [Erpetoichthys calabaricus]